MIEWRTDAKDVKMRLRFVLWHFLTLSVIYWQTDAQQYGISFLPYLLSRSRRFFFNEIQSKGNIGKRNRINWLIFRFGKILRNLSLKSFTQDEKFEVFPFLIYDAWNAVLSICEAWIFLNFVRETGSPFAILLPYLYEIIFFFTLRLKIFLRKGEFLL